MITTRDWHKRVYQKKSRKYKFNMDEWIKLKHECFKRDHFTCQRCDKRNSQGRGMTAHHITPRSEGGADDISNLITLCSSCHDYVEINELRSRALIEGSLESIQVNTVKPTKEVNDEGYHFKRPEWHKYVYGGAKHEQGK